MRELTTAGELALQHIAGRHGFSLEAARTMLDAVSRGNGSMAQFSHREFGGSGQWMRGGMTMISDMFNQPLKRSVTALCDDLAALVADESAPARHDSQTHHEGAAETDRSRGQLFRSAQGWWPGDLGSPDASGSQNGARYAYFAGPCRLAIEVSGRVTVYDTQDHRISGVSQQQASGRSMTFTGQHGPVDVASLPMVSGTETPRPSPLSANTPAPGPERSLEVADPRNAAPVHDLFTSIEKLAALHASGILSEEEFVNKKVELLNRL